MRTEEHLLALGGVHALNGVEPCQLTQVEPASALEDLRWKHGLVVRATGEGRAELTCGSKRTRLRIAKPARLELVLVEDRVMLGERFHVRPVPRGSDGQEMEIGKWSELVWRGDSVVAPDEDPTAGEFGIGGNYGVQAFRASASSVGAIEARLGDVVGTLRVTARP